MKRSSYSSYNHYIYYDWPRFNTTNICFQNYYDEIVISVLISMNKRTYMQIIHN